MDSAQRSTPFFKRPRHLTLENRRNVPSSKFIDTG
ncbi:hypothetical protein M0802_003455 [Mischocyttarus mexicanus]|nr:hypothetical protein M0802_003455 [Mischocyttarus mexicanus]